MKKKKKENLIPNKYYLVDDKCGVIFPAKLMFIGKDLTMKKITGGYFLTKLKFLKEIRYENR